MVEGAGIVPARMVPGAEAKRAEARGVQGAATAASAAAAVAAPTGGRYRGAQPAPVFSPRTAVYDLHARFPVLFLFQIAHPKPGRSAWSDLFAEAGGMPPPAAMRADVSRFAPRPAGPGGLFEASA